MIENRKSPARVPSNIHESVASDKPTYLERVSAGDQTRRHRMQPPIPSTRIHNSTTGESLAWISMDQRETRNAFQRNAMKSDRIHRFRRFTSNSLSTIFDDSASVSIRER